MFLTQHPLLLFLALLLWCALLPGGEERHWRFARGAWSPQEWLMVRSPRFPHQGEWLQEEESIANRVPPPLEDSLQAYQERLQGPDSPRTYVSMVLAGAVCSRRATIQATMAFEYRMAPLLVLANDLGEDSQGNPEYREHWEIVLYDQGINVWHHEMREGRPYWSLAAFLQAPFAANQPHRLAADIERTPKGHRLTIRCGGMVFGCLLPQLQNEYRVGLTACEGVNRFWDFSLKADD